MNGFKKSTAKRLQLELSNLDQSIKIALGQNNTTYIGEYFTAQNHINSIIESLFTESEYQVLINS
jgi:hypothetical protein